ncbi:MAG: glycosyltransferase [Solirubrobacteraceae bacterium]
MSLVLELERELPTTLAAGRATTVFCIGICTATEGPVDALRIEVDGIRHPVAAFAMPRPDRAAAGHLLRSGFWALVPVQAGEPGETIQLTAVARLSGGGEAEAQLGQITVVGTGGDRPVLTPPSEVDADTIAVCMATYEPDLRLFSAQVGSLREQTDARWVCLISDDGSSPKRFAEMAALVGEDPRFVLTRSEQRLGFYGNFERALGLVPDAVSLIALCDQDDRWQPDKLAALRAGLGDALLVYSDLRLLDADGALLRDTLWAGRANNHTSLTSMLVANTVTGAAVLFTRELLELVLPFPDTPGFQFHDAWLAVMALTAGHVAYVDRALYGYVQHPGAVFGDVTHGPRDSNRWAWLRARAGPGPGFVTRWRAAYFHGYLARAAQAQVALARCQPRIAPAKRRALERFLACEHSWSALLWLALRPARALAGHTETLGSELGLAQGVLWKRLAIAAARHPHFAPRALRDASAPPPQFFSQRRLRRWRARL